MWMFSKVFFANEVKWDGKINLHKKKFDKIRKTVTFYAPKRYEPIEVDNKTGLYVYFRATGPQTVMLTKKLKNKYGLYYDGCTIMIFKSDGIIIFICFARTHSKRK